jgi:dolichol-phosphate mannosyltransferase
MNSRWLTALPVYNEVRYVDGVLDEVSEYSPEILVVDDGSTDGTAEVLSARNDIQVVRHARNRGYGEGLNTAFQFAIRNGYDYLVTIDCDGQHEPQRIPQFVAACQDADIVSGSRYLRQFDGDHEPPADRQRINRLITDELNRRLGLQLTDAFCGFKAYRVRALRHLHVTETGYAMPIELWVQAVAARLRIIELPVPLIYLDESRSFGGELDNAATRLEHYYEVLERSWEAVRGPGAHIAAEVLAGASPSVELERGIW